MARHGPVADNSTNTLTSDLGPVLPAGSGSGSRRTGTPRCTAAPASSTFRTTGGISNQLGQQPPFGGSVSYLASNGYCITFTGQTSAPGSP